jgi:hypothetical protein
MSQVISAMALNAEVYPNPATENATVKFHASSAGDYTLILSDIIGRQMLNLGGAAVEGDNMIELNLSAIAKGVYMLSVINNGSTEQIRVIVE